MENKVCKWCGKEKDLAEFYSQKKKRSDGTEYIYYRPDCKECTKKNAVKWRYENPEVYERSQMKWLQSKKGIESNKKRQRRRRESGKYREWQKKNKEKLRQYASQRQHKAHAITEQEWIDCKDYFENQCAYCGLTHKEHLDVYGQDLHKEHVDHNGSNSLSNCVPSCKPCNGSKHTFDFEYWYKERSGHYSEERFQKIAQWLNNDYKKFIENQIKI